MSTRFPLDSMSTCWIWAAKRRRACVYTVLYSVRERACVICGRDKRVGVGAVGPTCRVSKKCLAVGIAYPRARRALLEEQRRARRAPPPVGRQNCRPDERFQAKSPPQNAKIFFGPRPTGAGGLRPAPYGRGALRADTHAQIHIMKPGKVSKQVSGQVCS